MKQVFLSLFLASALFALAGAVFFARSVPGPESGRRYEELAAKVEGEVAALRGRLEDLERTLSSTARGDRRGPGSDVVLARSPGAAAVPGASGGGAGGEGGEAVKKDAARALASLASGDDDLRNFVQQVIQEEREERRQEEQRKFKERQDELAALTNGPYGQFNFRVNTLGKRLGLSDPQKQRYHELLADYSARIEEIRKNLDRQDQVAYKSYQDRKRQMINEFDGLVIQSLTPLQSQEYQGMTSREKSPALENASGGGSIAYSTITPDGDVAIERRAGIILSGEGADPAPVMAKLPFLEKLFEVPAAEPEATPAAK